MSSPETATTDWAKSHPAPESYSGLRAVAFGLSFAVLAILVLVPLVLVHTLPLFDYPNHMARMHILADWASSADLQRFYRVEWHALPNLAMDAIVPALAGIVPMALAGKLFVAGVMLSIPVGVASLHRVLSGRWSAWSLLGFGLVFSRFLLWGFLNFLVGTGISLIAMASWIGWRERRATLAVVTTSLLALVVYFSHLAAFGALAAVIGAYELGVLQRRGELLSARAIPRLAIAALPFILPAILFLTTPSGSGGPIVFSHFARKLDLPFSLFNNYSAFIDGVTAAIFVGVFAIGLWRGWVRLTPAMKLPLLVLAVLYLAMPNQIYTAASVDHRLPLVIALVLIASTDLAPMPLRRARIGAAVAVLLLVVRVGVAAGHWLAFDALYAQYQAALDTMPAGAKLAVAHPVDGVRIKASIPPLLHFPLTAVSDRDAFVPSLFAYPSQQPVSFQPDYAMLATSLSPDALWSVFVGGQGTAPAALADYDYVVFAGTEPFQIADNARLAPVFQSPLFRLYRIVK